jgi:hypothetical protein
VEEAAKHTGALVRRRAIKNARDLLTALLLYACGNLSMTNLAASAERTGIAAISDQAWQKSF